MEDLAAEFGLKTQVRSSKHLTFFLLIWRKIKFLKCNVVSQG